MKFLLKELPLSFIVNNEKITLKDKRVVFSQVTKKDDIMSGEFVILDFNLKITAIYKENSDFNACEWFFYLENIGEIPTPVIKNLLPCDMTFNIENNPTIRYAKGASCTREDFRPYEIEVKGWNNFKLRAEGGRSSGIFLPFFNMNFGDFGYMGAIGWTGDWECNWYRNGLSENELNFTMGMSETCFYLYPKEKVRTPKMAFVEYKGSVRDGQNKLRKYIAKYHNHILNVTGKDKMPIFCHHWGETLCSTHVKNVELMNKNKVIYDYYWIDASWFGEDPAWMPCTGDWDNIKPLYPNKFKPLTDTLHKYNKKFLLWFEPERICKNTGFEKLGKWLLDIPSDKVALRPDYIDADDPRYIPIENSRNSFGYDEKLIDFSNPDAVDWYIEYFSKFIKDNEIDFFRNDSNVAVDAYLKANDKENRIGITEMKWFEGLYRFWDGLLERNPGLMIDNCAAGGRRMDIEMMDRAVTLTRTDYAWDINRVQNHSLGLNEWFANQGSSTGALAKHTVSDINYDVVSAMTAELIFTIYRIDPCEQADPENIEADYIEINNAIAKYRKIQPYFTFDYYPLTEYSVSDCAVVAYAFYEKELDKGMIVVINRDNSYTKSVEFDMEFVQEREYKLNFVFNSFDMKLENKKLTVNLDEKRKAVVATF